MRTDVTAWISRYNAEAAREGNAKKQQVCRLYNEGWNCLRKAQHDEALVFFTKGSELAEELQELCWKLYLDYMITEVFLYYKIDYTTGLDLAIKVAGRAHKAEYHDCPIRGKAYFNMLQAYYSIDTLGYEAEIRAMMHEIDTNIPLDDDTAQRMQFIRSGLAFALEDYVTAEDEVQIYLNMCNSSFRKRSAYGMLRVLAYVKGDIPMAFNYAYQESVHASNAQLHPNHSYALLWQGVYAQYLGQSDRAKDLVEQGLQVHERYNLKRRFSYYDSLANYHELCGELHRALTLREEQVAIITTLGSPDSDAYARLQYCRFLGRTGRDIQAALQACYHAAQGLRKPDLYLEKLKRIEAGDYYEYDWQKE